MKKNFLFLFLFFSFLVSKQAFVKTDYLDAITLANIEAIASTESSSGKSFACWSTVTSKGSEAMTDITYCGNCQPVPANGWSNKNGCNR